jgi:hypothetical protein
MGKIIAVDGRFEKLAARLEEKGYKVVDMYGQPTGVDVCIYYDGIRDFHNTDFSAGKRVLMIDGKGKTVEDIEAILQSGVYSSLF